MCENKCILSVESSNYLLSQRVWRCSQPLCQSLSLLFVSALSLSLFRVGIRVFQRGSHSELGWEGPAAGSGAGFGLRYGGSSDAHEQEPKGGSAGQRGLALWRMDGCLSFFSVWAFICIRFCLFRNVLLFLRLCVSVCVFLSLCACVLVSASCLCVWSLASGGFSAPACGCYHPPASPLAPITKQIRPSLAR